MAGRNKAGGARGSAGGGVRGGRGGRKRARARLSPEVDTGASLRRALSERAASTPRAAGDAARPAPTSHRVTSIVSAVLAAQAAPPAIAAPSQGPGPGPSPGPGPVPSTAPLPPTGGGKTVAARVLHVTRTDSATGATGSSAPLPASSRARPSAAMSPATAREWTIEELHRLPCTLGDQDFHLFGEGNHRRLWQVLGSHPRILDGIEGTSFAVWAPNAQRVSVVGDFCAWDGQRYPLRHLGGSGIHELFVPGVQPGDLYKYEIVGADGATVLKTDPMAFKHEQFPGDAAIVQRLDHHAWGDGAWMAARARRDPLHEPMAIYECHLASWARVPEDGNRPLTYREIAPRLAEHCRALGFTHVELMPVMEHAFGGSWGYQVTGYYAPTSRHGTPDDLRFLVDTLHQAGLGVLLDWVPAHFPNDRHALQRFDGTALYEHDDPRLGQHPDWDTLIFNYGRNEVRNFLMANALYWLEEFHADGLRVDAVASMLYLDYSRKSGEWIPNRWGGRENLDAIEFLKALNAIVAQECPGCLMIAEESTAWGGVTRPVSEDGLGFAFKWNMGWMHDTLDWFSRDPIHRRFHHDEITFAMLYEFSERFINPLSHDEVVHGKGSLHHKLPGDAWQKLANLRLLLAYQYARPGKKLVFMGTELAQEREWDHDGSLDWHLLDDPGRQGLQRFLTDLSALYRRLPCFWRRDGDPETFQWIDCKDRDNSVLAWLRWDGSSHVAVVLNGTPVPRGNYRIGVPRGGRYRCIFSSDADVYGGSNYPTRSLLPAEDHPFHGFAQSVVLDLPPLAALMLQPES